MDRRKGEKIHYTNLKREHRYIMAIGKQEALVRFEAITPYGIKVLIEDGGIKSLKLNTSIGKGSEFYAPEDALFYEPRV